MDDLISTISGEDYPTLEHYKTAYRSLEYIGMGEWKSSADPNWYGDEEDFAHLCSVIASLVCEE
jgi:hypothetical protein